MGTHVFETMGTTASLRTAGELPAPAVLTAVAGAFTERDARFSLYRPDSEAFQLAEAQRTLLGSSDAMRQAYAEAMSWYARTGGAFTPHRPDGVVDLSGTVKADAIAAAGDILVAAGCHDWMVNAGGDILWSGTRDDGPWRVGIVDPDDRRELLCTLEAPSERRALATSGTSERGEHVWRARGETVGRLRQVTVLAGDIVTADVLATAILAGGEDLMSDAIERFGIDVLCVDGDGRVLASGPFQRAEGLLAM